MTPPIVAQAIEVPIGTSCEEQLAYYKEQLASSGELGCLLQKAKDALTEDNKRLAEENASLKNESLQARKAVKLSWPSASDAAMREAVVDALFADSTLDGPGGFRSIAGLPITEDQCQSMQDSINADIIWEWEP